ncbi:hypothetical protein HPB49_003097 [Dermacentor silvarum]|uniref:Uncharacterized protein n=1 Tax=Dermacentor silvarum TaxID=543639 RepID=A0ACB8DAF4_DERSI|nr:hypothetical protein HPB49_003097 [Dermacentor silvarum]
MQMDREHDELSTSCAATDEPVSVTEFTSSDVDVDHAGQLDISKSSSPKPPHHCGNATSEAANPSARNTAHDAAAATRSGKTPARLPPATKETRLTVQRSKQLPPLPPKAIRVVVRPRGELRLLDVPTPRLTKAVQTQLRITLPDDFCLRTHPANNTFTMTTTHFPTAETLKTLTSLEIGDQTYPCTAYVAPPPGATGGVITNAYDDETPTQLYQDLVRRNPEYTILAARRMGKTHSIQITFDANAVPHSIKYMGAIHRCTLSATVRMPVPIADSRVTVTTYAQAPRPIFAPAVEHSIRNKTPLVRPRAFCVRALTLPARDRARDETFTSHGNSQATQKRSSRNRSHPETVFPNCHADPPSPTNTSKPEQRN